MKEKINKDWLSLTIWVDCEHSTDKETAYVKSKHKNIWLEGPSGRYAP